MNFIKNKNNILWTSLVAFCLCLILIFGPSFAVMLVCGLVFLLVSWRIIYVRKLLVLQRLYLVAAVLGIISFFMIEALVISELQNDESQFTDLDVVIVLGAGLNGSELSLTLEQRLETALTFLKNNRTIPVLLTGGQGPGEDLPEAEAMSNYLTSNGITGDRIILESHSTSTEENFAFSREVLVEQGVKHEKILVITSDFHMFRSKLIARNNGFEVYGLSSPSSFFVRINYMVREYFAIIKTILLNTKTIIRI